ncbi:hypothetical protein [Mycolicibacterium austroafricanum]|uniref:hypothetical protein n=1 Tax=Mycolicibacterium austroafricanum TaxID=39687 RepID=UPI001CA37B0D|nr:hypothetical protein [Mycolicibacterium austroafricanum]QZT60702.1 hypothetical protein JN085_16815 [Mycolicibacterium austroafricanum]
MHPYITAGVALVGASVVAIAPIAPQPDLDVRANLETRTASPAVSLAANSILNVPQNLWNVMVSSVAWHVEGVQLLADAMASSGNWNVDSGNPNNVWGWDPANPPMLEGIVRMIAPFRPFSDPLAYQMNSWAKANLPMHPGCPAFTCPDPQALLGVMFKVPIWEFWRPEGVTFGVDQYTPEFNPVGGAPVPWYGENAQFSPWDPYRSFFEYLVRDPADQPEEFQLKTTTLYDIVTAYANLARGLQVTGHLPSFIAVDEIETFVKLFIPKPATAAPADEATGATAVPELTLARTVTVDVPSADGQTAAIDNQTENGALAVTATDSSSDVGAEPEIKKSQPVVADPAEELDKVSQPAASDDDEGVDAADATADTTAADATPESTTTTAETRKEQEAQVNESPEAAADDNADDNGAEQGGRHRAEDRKAADNDSAGGDGAAAA